MKKLFAFMLFTSLMGQLGAWNAFKVKNNTKKPVEFSTQSIKRDIRPGSSITIMKPNVLRKKTKKAWEVELGILDGNWFKIGEKTPARGRTYTIAPRVNIRNNASGEIKVKTILNNKPLPKGFKYHQYTMGLRTLPKSEPYLTQKFTIENDTFYKVTLFSCNTNDEIKIKPKRKRANNKGYNIKKFKVRSSLYENFKPNKGLAVSTKFKIVDKNNTFSLMVLINGKTHKFKIQVQPELNPKTVLKISNLIGFKIK